MRSTLLVYTGSLILVILIAIISSLTAYTSYTEIVQQNLDDAVVLSVKMCQDGMDLYLDDALTETNYSRNVSFTNDNLSDFKKNFIKYLTYDLNSNVDNIDVDFFGADESNGLLSVRVTAHFRYPTGHEGTVKTTKTVILDKYVKE